MTCGDERVSDPTKGLYERGAILRTTMESNRDMGTPSGIPPRAKRWQVRSVLVLVTWMSLGIVLFSWSEVTAGETARPTAKDLPPTAADGMDPVTKFLLDDALAQGRITKQRYMALSRDFEEQAYLRQSTFKFWYDRGFNLGTNDNSFLLKIRGRLNVEFAQAFRNQAWRNPGDAKNFPDIVGVFGDYRANRSDGEISTVSLQQARLLFMGHVFSPNWKYFLQIGADTVSQGSQTQNSVQLLDYYGQITHIDWAQAQIGQYLVYFSRSLINSPASMQFARRALVSDAFTASGLNPRDIGLTIMNDDEVYPVNYYLGVFGGTGPNFISTGNFDSEQITQGCPGGQQPPTTPLPPGAANCTDPTNTTNPQSPLQRNLNADTRSNVNKLMFAGRLNWNVMGRPGYGEGDIVYSQNPQLAFGGGYAYNPDINTSTDNAFIGTDLANLNIRRMIAAGGNGRPLGWGVVDYSTWTADGVFKYRGFSLQGEFFFKNVTRHDAGRPCVNWAQQANGVIQAGAPFICLQQTPGELGNAQGWYVQSGYYIVPRFLELAGRYAYWDPDTHSGSDVVQETDVSLNWFFKGTYDYHLQFTYSNIAMGTGGYAIGRSNPMPQINSATNGQQVPNGSVPVDGVGGRLIENVFRVQFQLFF